MKKVFLFLALMLAISVAFAQKGMRMTETQIPSVPPIVSSISTEKSCTSDSDCLGIVCPMAIGMDTPQCYQGKCICGPNPALNLTLNKTKIEECLRIREQIKAKIREGNYSKEEIEKLREKYKECWPQPQPIPPEKIVNRTKIQEIIKKYREEKGNLTQAFVESIKELNEMKTDLVLTSGLTGKELSDKIKEINDQRKEIVKDYVDKIKEINLARNQELKEVIQEIEIGKNVSVDKEKVNITKIVVTVNGQEVEIKPGDNVTISVEGVMVRSKVPLKWIKGKLEDAETNATLNVTPNQIKVRERVREMVLTRKGNNLVYLVNAEKSGRILGLIPVNVQVNYEISAENGKEISVTRPWWAFLVFG